ncbi:HD domain-containing protein [Mycoplasmatota bacterium]|nr:HD domain-containing protein [Mycoplasmatota bacterium]
MLPSRKEAQDMILEAEKLNPGPWVKHVYYTALAAELIAQKHPNLDSEKAYICGLLHDIGRREGIYDLHHTIYGYKYLKDLGYEEVGRISLTHSFVHHDISDFNGNFDCTEEELRFLKSYIEKVTYDDYDKLIQVCDYLALPNGFCILEKRMIDVALRRGVNDLTIGKWKKVFSLKQEIEKSINQSIYNLLPNIIENTLS